VCYSAYISVKVFIKLQKVNITIVTVTSMYKINLYLFHYSQSYLYTILYDQKCYYACTQHLYIINYDYQVTKAIIAIIIIITVTADTENSLCCICMV
jgi:hypothetical protein